MIKKIWFGFLDKVFALIKRMNINIWKIFFIGFCILLGLMCWGGGPQGVMTLTELNLLLGCFVALLFTFVGGYFYALGWNKRLYSLRVNKIILSSIILYALMCIVLSVSGNLPMLVFEYKSQLEGSVSETSIMICAILLLGLISLVIYSILNLPALIAFFKYKSRYETLDVVEKPYWKLFLTLAVGVNLVRFVYTFVALHYPTANVWDFVYILSTLIVDSLIMIGFAYNIKFGPQKLWKIIVAPYMLLCVLSAIYSSESLKIIAGFELIFSSYVALIVATLMTAVALLVIYRYSFTKDVYKDEEPTEL